MTVAMEEIGLLHLQLEGTGNVTKYLAIFYAYNVMVATLSKSDNEI